jgi:hypothetical protein
MVSLKNTIVGWSFEHAFGDQQREAGEELR